MLAEFNTPCQTQVEASIYDRNSISNLDISRPITLKATFDCGVQANLDEMNNPQTDISGIDDLLIKKRQKRKQYKKRKKIQKKIMQRQNKQQFKQIIDLFYQRQAKFIDYSDKLQELVCSFNQNQFKNIFDSILKQRVVVIQNSIWEYTQAILQQNPLEMRHDHPFYLQMVDQIYKYYKLIEKSSLQAQQVIYIYLSLNSKDNDQPITPQDLGRRTFRYLIQTDETLRKLLHMCDKKISLVRQIQRHKLEMLISKLKNFRERFENNILDDEDDTEGYYDSEEYQAQDDREEHQEYEDEKETAISQTSQDFQEGQNSSIKKKKKKRLHLQLQSEQEKLYYYLQNLNIDSQNRLQCYLEQDFGLRALTKSKNANRSFKKQNQFDLLRVKLLQIQPSTSVLTQFKRIH